MKKFGIEPNVYRVNVKIGVYSFLCRVKRKLKCRMFCYYFNR